jgi:hypothetical protein
VDGDEWPLNTARSLLFVDLFIIVQFLQWKTQQDATVYQNLLLFLILNETHHVSGDTAHHQEPKTAQATSGFAYLPHMQNRRLLVQF